MIYDVAAYEKRMEMREREKERDILMYYNRIEREKERANVVLCITIFSFIPN